VAVQPTLVSGTNIKTINGGSVLGSGDLAVGGGAWTHISTVTASSVASVNIEGMTSAYDVYVIIGVNISNVIDQNIAARMRYNGSYLTADYEWTRINNDAGSGVTGPSNTNSGFIPELAFVDNASTSRTNIEMYVFNPSSVSTRNFVMTRAIVAGNTFIGHRLAMARNTSATASSFALTGIQFLGQNGTNFSGTFRLYGIKNS
jgi:hypothetical protein